MTKVLEVEWNRLDMEFEETRWRKIVLLEMAPPEIYTTKYRVARHEAMLPAAASRTRDRDAKK